MEEVIDINNINKTKSMVLTAMFTALITAGAYIRIPVPICPFTLQFLFTTLAGIILGKNKGAAATALYVILGLAGLPVLQAEAVSVMCGSRHSDILSDL